MLYDLLGMIRQLGACTWFITLSSADLKWIDTIKIIARQQGTELSNEEIQNLSWEERSFWLRSNPVTAARHFDNRVQLLMNHILLNKKAKPLGNIVDYKYRIEFQQRGSPHVHMLAWVEDAPEIESSTAEDVQEFIDEYIACSIPNQEPHLKELLLHVQKHSHSVACRKHGQNCRFGYPRPPINNTVVAKPPTESISEATREHYGEILTKIQESLENIDCSSEVTLEELLQMHSISEERYIEALIWAKTKNGQPAVLLKRKPSEVNINNYNKTLMKAWEANLDVQFVTNVYACVMYVASYISKAERTLGDVLKAVSSESVHLGTKQSMKTVAKKFLTHREVSAQEAVYRLLSLPLTRGSRQVIFVPTDLPNNRTRLIKPLIMIQKLEDDDPDVFAKGILERYQARPNQLEDMCLAEFASKYSLGSKKESDDTRNTSYEDESSTDREQMQTITLKNEMGTMTLRRRSAIIRSHQFSAVKQPEQFYHAQLLLYYPWRKESDLFENSYEDSYKTKIEIITPHKKVYEYKVDEVTDALDNLQELGDPEDAWSKLAPQNEQAQYEDSEEGPLQIKNAFNAFNGSTEKQASKDLGLIPYEYELHSEKCSELQWRDMVLSLNSTQSKVHQHIFQWAINMTLTHVLTKPEQFHLFLTGGAGVGKSHLVKTIVQTVTRVFSRNSQEENHVLVCAPTGAAAYNINGYTIHSSLLLPIHSKPTDDYISLANEKLAEVKEAIGQIKLLIIDEISMVGSDMLLTMHRRLTDIMGNDDPFGGISVLAVGDLLQLPAVAQKPVFDNPSDEMAALYGSLWKRNFKIVELTEIQRQKDDMQFASLLNRVRVGQHTEDDLNVLKTRQINKESDEYPGLCTHIFAYNRDVNQHNECMLSTLPGPLFTISSLDSKNDNQTGRIDSVSLSDKAGGLSKEITLGVGAKVMLTTNLDTKDGLVNSAAGIVSGFIPSTQPTSTSNDFKPKYILVKFDDESVGKRCRQLNKKILPDKTSTPIGMHEVHVRLGKHNKISTKRKQFPLALAWAVTIHKEQGKTETAVVLSCKGSFKAGQLYTAISRTTSMAGLYILDKIDPTKIKVNKSSLTEIDRMKKYAKFAPSVPVSVSGNSDLYFKISFLNAQSLHAHQQCLLKDQYLTNAHVLCIAETWYKSNDLNPEIENHLVVRRDRELSPMMHRSGGLITYYHHDFHLEKEYHVNDHEIEHQVMLLSTRWNGLRIMVVSVYIHPMKTSHEIIKSLEKLLTTIPHQSVSTIIVGDFNIDYTSNSRIANDLKKMMRYYRFSNLIKEPTHRSGSSIDHFYTNVTCKHTNIDISGCYYSDHFRITASIPYEIMHSFEAK